ncbi:MAG: hypothetical protein AB1898_22670 [Acidobacteriota bacterium]
MRASFIDQELKRHRVSHLIGLPDNTSAALFALLQDESDPRLISVTREGEAFAIAAGLWVGGRLPVVFIQNTGLLESGDSLRGTVIRMRVPLVCFLTYRGFASLNSLKPKPGEVDAEILSRPGLDSVALMTESTLQSWGLPYDFLSNESEERAAQQIDGAFRKAEILSQPVVLLVTKDLTP